MDRKLTPPPAALLAALLMTVATGVADAAAAGRVVAVSARIEYKGEPAGIGVLQTALGNALTAEGHRIELLGPEASGLPAAELVGLLRQGARGPAFLRHARDADVLLVAEGQILEGRKLPYGRGQISVHATCRAELYEVESGLLIFSCPRPARAMDADNFEEQAVQKAVTRLGRELGGQVARALAGIEPAEQRRRVVGNPCGDIVDESDVARGIPHAAAPNPHAWAVVIGNRDYRNEDIIPVEFAVRDACLMKRYLELALGVPSDRIITRYDADLAQMNLLFGTRDEPRGQLAQLVDPGRSDLYVYYCGHGAPYPAGSDGQPYLVPHNGHPDNLGTTGYPLEQLYANLQALGARSLTVILDACFTGGSIMKDHSPVSISVDNPWRDAGAAVCFTASGPAETASWHRSQQHGLFTYYFLKALKGEADGDGDGAITVGEIDGYLQSKVKTAAFRLHNRSQNPQTHGEAGRTVATLEK